MSEHSSTLIRMKYRDFLHATKRGEGRAMDTSEANIAFRYSERLKSNLFLLESALRRLEALKGERRSGGKEVAQAVFGAMRNELNIARPYLPSEEVNRIEGKLLELGGNMALDEYSKARGNFAQILSLVTTLCHRYIDRAT